MNDQELEELSAIRADLIKADRRLAAAGLCIFEVYNAIRRLYVMGADRPKDDEQQ